MRFFFLPLVLAEIICNYDEPCLKACTDTVCDYYWNIEHRYSRTWRTKDYGSKGDYPKGAYRDFPIFWNKTTNSLDIIDSGISTGVEHIYNEDGTIKDPLDDLENLFLIDGQEERRAITINGQLPGPTIIVNKGALVRIHVKSALHEESLTMHWHGLHQIDNFWNDGAAMINQCPIDAFNAFTYVMRADNSGTHWYHSHYGIQRADGLHGAFIILEDGDEEENMSWIPMVITDWYSADSLYLAGTDPYRYGNLNGTRFTGPATRICNTEQKGFMTGVKMSSYCVDSIVANGRGQLRLPISEENPEQKEFFFSVGEEYHVSETTTKIQLKSIHAGFEYPIFIRSADGRQLTLTATDGRRILPEQGDGVFMGVGETWNIEFDFPLGEDRLEIIAEIIFEGLGKKAKKVERPYVRIVVVRDAYVTGSEVKTELVPVYPDAQIQDMFDFDSGNDASQKQLLNCPMTHIVDMPCKTVTEFQRDPDFESRFDHPPPSLMATPDRVVDLNMNFATGSSFNGIKFKYPDRPFFDNPENMDFTKCTKEQIENDGGYCTHLVEVEKDELVEFRITSAEHIENMSRRWQWTYHAIHVHGYEFFVTDIGFGVANETTGYIERNAPVFGCRGGHIKCMHTVFNEKMMSLRKSTFGREDHIAKNTVVVPAMGYVVLRLKASNPGIWPFHCHQMNHNYEGMAFALYVKDSEENKPFSYLPKNMPRCGDYHPKDTAINEESSVEGNDAKQTSLSIFFLVFTFLRINL